MSVRCTRIPEIPCRNAAAIIGPAPTSTTLASEPASDTITPCQKSWTYRPCDMPNETPPTTPMAPNSSVRRHAHGQLNTAYF
jgi:hypothetical protein